MRDRPKKRQKPTISSTEGRIEKRSDKIKVMIKLPDRDNFEPFLYRVCVTDLFHGHRVKVYGRPHQEASDRVLIVEKLVFREEDDLLSIVKLIVEHLNDLRDKKVAKCQDDDRETPSILEQSYQYLNKIMNHPAIEVNAGIFPRGQLRSVDI